MGGVGKLVRVFSSFLSSFRFFILLTVWDGVEVIKKTTIKQI